MNCVDLVSGDEDDCVVLDDAISKHIAAKRSHTVVATPTRKFKCRKKATESSSSSSTPKDFVKKVSQHVEFQNDDDLNLASMKPSRVNLHFMVQELGNLKSLRSLDLSKNKIGENSLKAITNWLENDNYFLQRLNLSNNLFGDDGLEYISSMLKVNTSIVHLDIQFNRLTDAGMHLLGQGLIANQTIQEILILEDTLVPGANNVAALLEKNKYILSREREFVERDPFSYYTSKLFALVPKLQSLRNSNMLDKRWGSLDCPRGEFRGEQWKQKWDAQVRAFCLMGNLELELTQLHVTLGSISELQRLNEKWTKNRISIIDKKNGDIKTLSRIRKSDGESILNLSSKFVDFVKAIFTKGDLGDLTSFEDRMIDAELCREQFHLTTQSKGCKMLEYVDDENDTSTNAVAQDFFKLYRHRFLPTELLWKDQNNVGLLSSQVTRQMKKLSYCFQLDASRDESLVDELKEVFEVATLENQFWIHNNPILSIPLSSFLETLGGLCRLYARLYFDIKQIHSYLKTAEELRNRFKHCNSPPVTSKLVSLRKQNHELLDKLENMELEVKQLARQPSKNDSCDAYFEKKSSFEASKLEYESQKWNQQIQDETYHLFQIARHHYPEYFWNPEWCDQLGVVDDSVLPRDYQVLISSLAWTDPHTNPPHYEKVIKGNVYLVDEEFVVKVYDLRHAQNAVCFCRQTQILKEVGKHFHLATPIAVYTTENTGVLRMPYLVKGALSTWMTDVPSSARSMEKCTLFLMDILNGLFFLHSNKLVHANIRADTILLSPSERAIISNFDNLRRIDECLVRMEGKDESKYVAPENRESFVTMYSASTDMFAFGILVQELFQGVEKMSDERRIHYHAFITGLLQDDPLLRTTSACALESPFLASKELEVRMCPVCGDSRQKSDGIECSNHHFMCDCCLSGQLTTISEAGFDHQLRENGGLVKCYDPTCSSKPFHPKDVLSHVNSQVYDKYMTAIKRHTEAKISLEKESEFQHRLDKVKKQMTEEGNHEKILDHIRRIEDDILTLKCPRNGHAFVDFDGCFALKCSSCPCNFCAWCLADCGNDAHAHVNSCRLNKSRGYYGSPDLFKQVHKERKLKLLSEFWNSNIKHQSPEFKKELKNELVKILDRSDKRFVANLI